MAVQMDKIVFILVTRSRGAVLRYFAHFCISLLFMFLYFLQSIQLLVIKFFADVLSNTSLRKLFYNISPSVGSHLEVLWELFLVTLFYS